MRELGICRRSGRLYEGSSDAGIPVTYHTPLLPIEFLGVESQSQIDEFGGLKGMIFREDSFDPITKIRRGRVYKLHGNQPVKWKVQDFSRQDLVSTKWAHGTAQELDAVGYHIDSLAYLREQKKLPKVVLGELPYHTYWKLISIETQFDGKPLITLKAISSFGTVPELIIKNIPTSAQALLSGAIDNVEATINRLGPIEVVDSCRSALSIVFGALADNLTLDLGAGISKRIEANKQNNPKYNGQDLITHNAEIVRRLHSRGKPNEMIKQQTRPVSDEDASLAVNCLWFVLIECGWAKA